MSHSPAPAKTGRARLMRVDDARAAMLLAVKPLAGEYTELDNALGRVLAGAITAMRDQPPFAVSAMDGYAIRSADTPGRLRVTGEAAAGRGFEGRCEEGGAIRISTGAAIPQGADTVIIQENTEVSGAQVNINVPAQRLGQHIRRQGLDFAKGQSLLRRGTLLGAREIGLAAAMNWPKLPVVRRPKVAIFTTGDELVCTIGGLGSCTARFHGRSAV